MELKDKCRIWKEVVVAYLKIPTHDLAGGTIGKGYKPQSEQPVS
jgi:hypothetical protein